MQDARLVPRAVLPYLEVAVAGQHAQFAQHAQLAPLRGEALEVLAAGYRSTSRTLLGLLAWALAAWGGIVLAVLPVQRAGAVATAAQAVLGLVLLGGGLWLGVGVLRAGRRITGAAAAWLRVPGAGATDSGAGGLLAVVRWRMVLGAGLAAAALALGVALAVAVGLTGPRAAGSDAAGDAAAAATAVVRAPVTAAPPVAVLVAVLVVAALSTAAVAVMTLAGVRTVLEAAWQQPAGVSEQTVELDLSSLRMPEPPTPPTPPTPPLAPSPRAEVLLPGGDVLAEGTTLLGRRPVPRPEDVVDAVVALSDQTVSKTHASVTVEGAHVRVVDRASTNGTLLQAPDGSLVRCRPWQVTTVPGSAIIHLGHTRLHVQSMVPSPLEVA